MANLRPNPYTKVCGSICGLSVPKNLPGSNLNGSGYTSGLWANNLDGDHEHTFKRRTWSVSL